MNPRSPGAGWLRLAIASLMLAGFTAGLVAAGRTPGMQSLVGPQGFKIFLVGHVNFSLSVWCLAFICAIWSLVAELYGTGIPDRLGRTGLRLAWAGTAAMAVATVFALGQPQLVDYLPVIGHPLFGTGMVLFFAGTSANAAGFLAATRMRAASEVVALRVSAVAQIAAMLALVLAVTAGWRGDWAGAAWGGGHLLQVSNAATLVACWLLFLRNPMLERPGSLAASEVAPDLRLVQFTLPIYLVPCIVVPALYLLPGDTPRGQIGLITWSAVVIPTVLALLVIGWRMVRHPRFDPPGYTLVTSLLLFAAGFAMAMFGMAGDTRVTAHYHGTVGAVTVAFMGLSFQMLPRLGIDLRGRSWARIQPMIYGLGLLLLIAGLYWASNFGGQRKVFETFANQKGLWGPMVFFGAGAIVGFAGGIAYIWIMGVSVFGRLRRPALDDLSQDPSLPPALPDPPAPGSRRSALVTALSLVGALALCAVLSGTAVASSYRLFATMEPRGQAQRPEAPGFTLVDQRGRDVALADLKGKPVLLTFGYTFCTTACPRILSGIRQALEQARVPPGGVEVVTISVDPERDTPERLAAFSSAWPSGWLFLTGDAPRVGRTWASYKIAVDRDDATARRMPPGGHEHEHGHAGGAHHDQTAGMPHDHMGHFGYTITHTNKVVVLDSAGRIASEHSGAWTTGELAGSVSKVLSGEQGRLNSPMLTAVREFLQRCGAFAALNPLAFFAIVLAIMLPGFIIPAVFIRTILISRRA